MLKGTVATVFDRTNSTHVFGLIVVYPITVQGHKTWWINNG